MKHTAKVQSSRKLTCIERHQQTSIQLQLARESAYRYYWLQTPYGYNQSSSVRFGNRINVLASVAKIKVAEAEHAKINIADVTLITDVHIGASGIAYSKDSPVYEALVISVEAGVLYI